MAFMNTPQTWASGGFTKPYIVTESGPAGELEVPNDSNGVPIQETDQQNAAAAAAAAPPPEEPKAKKSRGKTKQPAAASTEIITIREKRKVVMVA